MMLFLNMLLHSFLTSTQNADTSSLSSYFTNGHHHPLSLCSSGPPRHLCQNWSSSSSFLVVSSQLLPTGLLAELVFSIVTSHRHFWSSLLNSSQLVFLQNWSPQSSLMFVTPQLLPTGLLAGHIVIELVFPNIDFQN